MGLAIPFLDGNFFVMVKLCEPLLWMAGLEVHKIRLVQPLLSIILGRIIHGALAYADSSSLSCPLAF